MVETRISGVKDAEAIPSRLDLEERRYHAVDAIVVAIELLDPDRMFFRTVDNGGVVERTVVMEKAVLQHEWNLKLTFGKIKGLLCLVADEIEACQTGEYVQPGDAEAMIVIPKRC